MANYGFTGNPFVDSGLCVAAHVLGKNDPWALNLADLKKGLIDGRIGEYNSKLKSFTMIFGKNGPLTQDRYKHVDRPVLYTQILSNLLDGQQSCNHQSSMCEICGEYNAIDITGAFNSALSEFGLKANGIKVIGRHLMPMSGSIGNSAQALPGSVQPLNVCGRCLVAVNFLPLGSMLINGRLVTFECANQPLAMRLIRRIVDENISKLKAGDAKVEISGSKKSPKSVIERLLDLFEQTDPDEQGETKNPLYIWLYRNSGNGTDCMSMEIPSYALRFLREAIVYGYRSQINHLLKYDSKQQLLPCIQNRHFYRGLLPAKNNPGASLSFAQFYLNRICDISPIAILSAHRIAQQLSKSCSEKSLKKTDALRDAANKFAVRRIIADMAESGDIDLAAYDTLFPTIQHHPIRVAPLGWDILQLTMCKLNDQDSQELEEKPAMKTVHPKIEEASSLYFEDYVAGRGIERFKKDVLDRFSHNEIDVRWLRDKFALLAEKHQDFDYGDWDDFVCDENGKPQAWELLFQMRIRLANLYREYINNQKEV